MVHDDGQTNEVNSKGIPWYLMTISNSKEDTITKIKQSMVNSHIRAYHKKGRSGKNTMWSSKGLNVSMYLKHGLQGVVKVNVWMDPNKDKLGLTEEGRLKFLDYEDDRNKGSTCMIHETICSGKAEEATTIGRGGAKLGRRIWWFGWSPWLWWKEWL